jgi:hypothetical protein
MRFAYFWQGASGTSGERGGITITGNYIAFRRNEENPFLGIQSFQNSVGGEEGGDNQYSKSCVDLGMGLIIKGTKCCGVLPLPGL